MRGAMYNGVKKDVTLEQFEKPVVKPNTVLIKNVTAGICGTDLTAYLYDGDAVGIHSGNQFGHEMIGIIEEVGEGAEEFTLGTRVFVNPMCFRNIPEGWTPTMSADMAGAFSEYVLVEKPEWDVTLFKIPESVDSIKAALTEPLSVSMNGVLLSGATKGSKAIVYGAGPIGLGALAGLRFMGVEDIIVADTQPFRLDKVKEMGGIPCDVTKTPINDFAKELWGCGTNNFGEPTNLADVVIDCAGHPKAMRDFLDGAKMDSKFICIALGGTLEQTSVAEICLKVVQLIGSCGYTSKTVKTVLSMLESDIDVTPMITSVYGLSDVTIAFKEAANGSKNIKVIIEHSK